MKNNKIKIILTALILGVTFIPFDNLMRLNNYSNVEAIDVKKEDFSIEDINIKDLRNLNDFILNYKDSYIGSDSADVKVNAGTQVSGNIYIKDIQIRFLVSNDTNKSIDIKDANLKSLEINNIDSKDGLQFSFNGITNESKADDLEKTLGKATNIIEHGSVKQYYFSNSGFNLIFDVSLSGDIEKVIIEFKEDTISKDSNDSTSNTLNLSNLSNSSNGSNGNKSKEKLYVISSNANLSNTLSNKNKIKSISFDNSINSSNANSSSNSSNAGSLGDNISNSLNNINNKNINKYKDSKKEYKLDEKLSNFEIILLDKKYKIPMSIKDLINDGWDIDSKDRGELVPYMKYTLITRLKKDKLNIAVQVANLKNQKDIKVQEGTVIDMTITLNTNDPSDGEYIKLELPNNINSTSNFENVANAYEYGEIIEGENIKKIVLSADIQRYYEFIFNKANGDLVEIHLRNLVQIN